MLRSLDIRDVLIIDRLSLTLGAGLNVLTGETGAGKSILLDALGFVLGWRGRAELVRTGAAQGEVVEAVNLNAPGQVVIAVVDGEFVCKTLLMRAGRVRLKAANPTFADIEPRDGQSLDIWGVVVAAIKQFRV